MAGDDLDLPAIRTLFERRSHELKTIRSIVRQKTEECKRYFELCGDNPTMSELQLALAGKLGDNDGKLKASRSRLKELRQQISDFATRKEEFAALEARISESKLRIGDLRAQIAQQTEVISSANLQKSPAAKALSDIQGRRDQLKANSSDRLRVLEASKSEIATLRDRERQLQEQLSNLQNSLSSSKKSVADTKSYISSPLLSNLQKEVDQLERELDKACVTPVAVPDISGPEDLDQVYTDQITSLSAKVEQLKSVLRNSRARALEIDNSHKTAMSEKRQELETIRDQNNDRRSQIEATRLAIKESIRPLTQELEMWQQKLQDEQRSAESHERELHGRREQFESEIRESEAKLRELTGELTRVKALVRQQIQANEAKQKSGHRLKQEIEGLRGAALGLDSEIAANTEEITRLKGQIEAQGQNAIEKQRELRERDEGFGQTIRDLNTQIEGLEARVRLLPVADITTTRVTEDEVRQSVFALEKEFAARTVALATIQSDYEKAEQLRRRFEAALELMTELEDEEMFMISELKMLRVQFAGTLRMLRGEQQT
jgi:chromosome segregation ATPase